MAGISETAFLPAGKNGRKIRFKIGFQTQNMRPGSAGRSRAVFQRNVSSKHLRAKSHTKKRKSFRRSVGFGHDDAKKRRRIAQSAKAGAQIGRMAQAIARNAPVSAFCRQGAAKAHCAKRKSRSPNRAYGASHSPKRARIGFCRQGAAKAHCAKRKSRSINRTRRFAPKLLKMHDIRIFRFRIARYSLILPKTHKTRRVFDRFAHNILARIVFGAVRKRVAPNARGM